MAFPEGLDYSAARPSGKAIKAAGYNFVIRYVGTPGRTKNITKAEYADLTGAGVGVALVYENKAGDALGGFNAGVTAAVNARNDARSIGFPSSRPIYFAVDQDIVSETQFKTVMQYLRGAQSVMGTAAQTGVYGEYDVVTRARNEGITNYEWQTAAWSKGKRDPNAELFQKVGYVYIGTMAADENDMQKSDYGQHNFNSTGDDLTSEEHNALLDMHAAMKTAYDLTGKNLGQLSAEIVGALTTDDGSTVGKGVALVREAIETEGGATGHGAVSVSDAQLDTIADKVIAKLITLQFVAK